MRRKNENWRYIEIFSLLSKSHRKCEMESEPKRVSEAHLRYCLSFVDLFHGLSSELRQRVRALYCMGMAPSLCLKKFNSGGRSGDGDPKRPKAPNLFFFFFLFFFRFVFLLFHASGTTPFGRVSTGMLHVWRGFTVHLLFLG